MKLIPYGHQWLDRDDINAMVKVLKSDWLTQGPLIKKFEDALCEYTGAKYAVCVSSGTAALHIACIAAGIKAGDEVITSAITFLASGNCVLYCQGRPVFADVESDTGNIEPAEIDNKVTPTTKAIIPVHFAGHPCDLDKIHAIARRYNLIIIEDAAHALGAKYKSSKIGSCRYSDMTIFSLHPLKTITTGEGGAVLTNNKGLYERLLLLRNHGITRDKGKMSRFDGLWYYEMQELGFNYRITDFQCALGLSQLKKIDSFIMRRRKIAEIYNRELSGIDSIELPQEKKYARSSWHLYPIKLKKHADIKRSIFEELRTKGIGAQVNYIPVYLQPHYQRIGYSSVRCPNAEEFYRSEISIPLYPSMNDRQIARVISGLRNILRNKDRKA